MNIFLIMISLVMTVKSRLLFSKLSYQVKFLKTCPYQQVSKSRGPNIWRKVNKNYGGKNKAAIHKILRQKICYFLFLFHFELKFHQNKGLLVWCIWYMFFSTTPHLTMYFMDTHRSGKIQMTIKCQKLITYVSKIWLIFFKNISQHCLLR